MKDAEVIVITGPTGSGKSHLAYRVASALNIPIILADTRCMYEDLNQGVSKPVEYMDKIKYYLHSFLKPYETFDAYRFYKAVLEVVKTHGRVIVEGGSIFYIKSIIEENLPDVYVPVNIRKMVNNLDGGEALGLLKEIDPLAYKIIDVKNIRRVKRALEIKLSTGKSKYEFNFTRNHYRKRVFKLIPEWDVLVFGLKSRVDIILPYMIEEVKNLIEKGIGKDAPVFLSSGYGYVFDYIYNKISIEKLKELIFLEHKKLARRQISFLKKIEGAVLKNPDADYVLNLCSATY